MSEDLVALFAREWIRRRQRQARPGELKGVLDRVAAHQALLPSVAHKRAETTVDDVPGSLDTELLFFDQVQLEILQTLERDTGELHVSKLRQDVVIEAELVITLQARANNRRPFHWNPLDVKLANRLSLRGDSRQWLRSELIRLVPLWKPLEIVELPAIYFLGDEHGARLEPLAVLRSIRKAGSFPALDPIPVETKR